MEIVIKAKNIVNRVFLLGIAAKYENLGNSLVPFDRLGKRNGVVNVAPNNMKFIVYLTKTSIVYEEVG